MIRPTPRICKGTLTQCRPATTRFSMEGVNAYPIALEDQKFLYLWNRGLRLFWWATASMKAALDCRLRTATRRSRIKLPKRVKAKDRLRSIALHTRVLENWARHDYDRMKGHRVPGTNFMQISETEAANLYDQFLDRLFLTRVRAMCCPFSCCSRVMMAGPGDTMTGVLFQVAFEKYADARGIPLLGTADALSQGDPQSSDLHPYFLDHAHLAEQGAAQGGGGPSSIS